MIKHYKKLALIILLLPVFQCLGQTQKEDQIDDAYHACLAKDTSVANISVCAFEAYGKWNKEMDVAYKKTMKSLKKDKDKATLKQSQAAWVAYRDAEFKSYDNMFNHPGAKWCRLRKDGQIDIVRARALQLRNYVESLKNR